MPITPQSPPATTPVLERITQNIIDTLKTITIANSYSFDADVLQPKAGIGDALVNGRIIVVIGEAIEETDRPETMKQWLQEFLICCEIVVSEKAGGDNLETRRNKVRAEVEWALTYDGTANRDNQTRGQLAEDTILEAPIMVPIPVDAHEAQVIVRVSVRYRTPYNNPFASVRDA